MFEAQVLHLLRRYLGEYVNDLSSETLRISVWQGDVVLKDLKLKAEALNSLNLPVAVKAGFVGTITLKVPWKSLGNEPVIVLIDRVFVLAHPTPDGRNLKEEDREKLFVAKIQQIEEAEAATLEAISGSKLESPPPGNSWLGSLIATIIGNLKITISNVHIRYEDCFSNPGHPFSFGVTLAKLAAVTMDEQGNETFDTSGALDKLRKSLQLERLAMYHDSDNLPWKIDKKWEDLSPKEWIEVFEDGINEPAADNEVVSMWAMNRNYLVSPINGVLKYHRLGNQERKNPDIPFEKASLVLSDVALTITEAQYHDWIKLLEVFSRYRAYVEISHLRPVVPVSKESYVLWWRYAAMAALHQRKMCYRFSWDQIRHMCQLRRRYIHLYASMLQQSSRVVNIEIREVEKALDSKVILLWRLLAHAKLESVKSKEAAEQRRLHKKSWFTLGWRTQSEDASDGDAFDGSQLTEERLSKEEWRAINKLLTYQPNEDLMSHSGKDMQNMIRFFVTVSINRAAARIININQTEIVCGRFEQLHVSTKFKHRNTHCDVTLRFYGVSAPEGSLAQSVCSEQKVNALTANFVHSPVGENVDWRLSATISPCHVTVLKESFDRFLEFVKRSNAVSPTVTLETATKLQTKIEKVTRRAHEQFQTVLEEQSRFALDIDLDAPKVRIPLRARSSFKCDSHFLLDFGHFTLHTMESQSDEQRQDIYSHFYISGRDIAAFFRDCGSDCQDCSLMKENSSVQSMVMSPRLEKVDNFYSLIDRCGMAVIVDQIKIPHPSFPSTRVSVQVPNLGIHFSPARYCRLMELLNILSFAMDPCVQPGVVDFQVGVAPRSVSDLATDAKILVWRGIGNSVASWQPCFIVLSGYYVYVLDSEKSQNHLRYLSMAGRQVHEVPSTNIGGSPFCIAVSPRGMDTQKALESSGTWVIEFQGEEEKVTWLRGLIQATYQASDPPLVDILGETTDGISESDDPQTRNSKAADLVINGAVVETKLCIYGETGEGVAEKLEEQLIIELLASGGKVKMISSASELVLKTKLHSLKIKDELQGRLFGNPHYLACSVLKYDSSLESNQTCDLNGDEMSGVHQDDDDTFKDALSEFVSSTNSDSLSHHMDMVDAYRFESDEVLIDEQDLAQGKGLSGEIFYDAQGGDDLDFVSVTFSKKGSGSPVYDGIDSKMSIRMSKLEFFCNRPTLVALIGFGFDLGSVGNKTSVTDANGTSKDKMDKGKAEESGCVEGLLGYDKARVVFYLNMDIDSVTVFLNKEDGSQLAIFVQESFLLDLKVRPASLSIEGTLGNMRLRDMTLGTDNWLGWLCDIRNPGVESLIKFKFNSFSAGDDDYEGYNYRLCGRLSAVRIVFLYRFVQEITVYFMELATPHTEEVIKLVDKVGDFEWLIQKSEIDGAAALKLDLTFDTPIIIVPRNSTSNEFVQLDVGLLKVRNKISWHGFPEKDPSAVRLDILHAEFLGVNMFVGIDGCIGKPLIRESRGLDVYVRRSLRDVFKKVPTFSLEVKIGFLHGVMSNKEYDVIRDCITMNLNEAPSLPPSFRGSKSGSKDTMRLLVDKVNLNSQMLLSRSVTILAVEVNYALLELCNGIHEESPLARIALEGLWVSYRMTSLSETDLYVTIPTFSVLDIRANTKPEMRLMLGSSADVPKQASTGNFPCFLNKSSSSRANSEAGIDLDVPISTMFLTDCRWRLSSQTYVLRFQQPRVLVVPDFLLALGEFFVPSLGAITGREETMNPKNDPISKNNSIILSSSIYKQNEDVVHLSRSRQLVADTHGIDEYTYDGCGKTIVLSDENEAKKSHPAQFCPIVIIGCGKRLRFVNVKIENGSLLRKYTFLSNDSSYSVSPEDDVDISLMDNLSSNDDEKLEENMELTNTPKTSCLQDGPNVAPSFTFEAQVVSLEFTFFDGTKSYLDDSSYGEKLLRAKMDLNFMYAYKENDTWIRAVVKDLTVETGSGLIILDPLDISGGYTSVKEKTNISLISTDICIHLSLGAISLLLNLQYQAAAALQFGNAIPLAPCINFDRIWVSPKENGSHNNLTIWRPQAPSNYVILGDCVTSSPIPPSQAVLAVSNTYGRVRKPVGFKHIGFLSHVLGLEGVDGHSGVDSDCSLWMPISPPGYISMGCVANVGNHPPPNHVVYCLRSDLVTSTTYSECLLNELPNQHFTSGFSIWRLDNVLGSFYAHSSIGYPSKGNSSDLSHLLLWSSVWSYASLQEYIPDTVDNNHSSQQTSNQGDSSSGWDILRSISKASSCYMSTPHFERIWWDKGGGLRRPVSIWRPIPCPGYAILGDCITEGLEPPALGIILKSEDPEISAKPVQFTKVAHITGKGFDEVFFWYPIAPPGYASLGCIVSRTDEAPCMDFFCCPRMDLVSPTNIIEVPISRNLSSKASHCWSIWKVENQASTFLARSDIKMPSMRLAYTISDSVKHKTRENVTAEIKLRFFSLTVLDSLHGMMTPLFDVTIANIKLVTHGRLEAMNAVFISSIAASTFNKHLEAWEPLVEPFDGIFKFETYDINVNSSSIIGKRMHIAATNIVNINVSAMNLDTLIETILSWRRQLELDQKATKLIEESGAHSGNQDLAFSALDEEDLQTVVVENQLGSDLYIKRIEQNSEVVDQLHHGGFASVWVPPARFSDRLNVAEESRQARYYVAAQILFAKDLPIVDDGNSHNFFCALRLVIDSQATDQQKLLPQSARTKCVKPLVSDKVYPKKGIAKWNELFIFEVPRKGVAKLEVEVTNLSAKAGKGEVVGALSFPIGHRANILKKLSSSRMLPPRNDTQNIESYSLRRKVQSNNVEDTYGHVKIFVSTSYFERNTTAIFQKDAESRDASDKDIGFWVRLGSEGSWESVRSLLPLSVVPKSFQSEFIAMEVVMRNGKKHAIFRGLATVVNDSDVNLDISVCHVSMIQDSGSSTPNIVVEEIFENQLYHPISGWGNKWPGFQGSDPACWSTRDFSCSSKEFFEPSLPNGWEWISTWTIDKSQFVDEDGWAYAADYPNQWPPTSSKSHIKSGHDVVRRRRWIRTRQLIAEKEKCCVKKDFTTINPGYSTVLSWGSTSKASDQCLRIRPSVDYPHPPYAWGHTVVVAVASNFASGKDQPFVDQCYIKSTSPQGSKKPNFALLLSQLEKKDILLCCSATVESRQIWLSVGADASALHTEFNHPVYDWRISVNSPLKLENRLSCPAEFTIWEKTKDRNYIEREHGIISSRMSAHIYSVDIQRPIYLSFLVQSDWVLEKDPVLILDLSSGAHISSFWMFHQQSKRRLRVSVERDMGGTGAAPKTIRFFVPYWIINDSALPLAYQVVEIEGSDNADMDSRSSKAVKSTRTVLRTPSYLAERRHSGPRRNIQVLEAIEDTSPIASMLSPQDSAGRSGVTLFTSQKDTYVSPRIGIAVALRDSEIYSPGISLLELEKKERFDVKAFSSDGYYYKLSALVNMTTDRTKVIHLQPYMLFVNRVGLSFCLQQCYSETVEWIHPTDPPKLFGWQSSSKAELLKLQVDGYGWSKPFSVSTEGLMRISLKNDTGSDHLFLKIEVRSGTKSSRYEVIFRPNSSSSPYRIENRSIFLPILFQQVDGTSGSWHLLLPNTAVSFLWEDLGRRHLLEILADGADPSRSGKYNIDEIFDHLPIDVAGPAQALRITILKEEKVNVVKISDWMPENEPPVIISQTIPSTLSELSRSESHQQQPQSTSECEFHFIVEFAELGVSIIDHTPEEILYLSLQNVHLAYSSGLGSGLSRFKLRMRGIQMDNQLPLTPTPVLFRPQKIGQETDYILKISVTLQTKGSLDLSVYPYIGFHGPDNSAFLINIHEPIIWRIHEMMQQVNLSRLSDSNTTAVSFDPIIHIGILNISEVRLKVSMAMSPSQRPRGVLGFWSSLMTALGNTENMTVKLNQRFHENLCMRQSMMINNAISNIKNDLLGQPLRLLSGLDILSNASSALGHMSKGVAALSMDKKFIQSRQRQGSKSVEDLGDVIREGGGALAKGLFRGVTGILTKPLEGAKSSGVEGFVQGVGKGIIGAAAQPVSGVLDLLSKTTEGANAMRLKIASAIASDEQILRRRLPRAVTGDSLLRPYDEYKARGQVILQLAQSGSFFVDIFKVRGKFALSDAYEDHFMLPKGKIIMVTHRRIILLQQTSLITQRKFNPMRDPCSVLWDVPWDDLKTMELTRGKKDLHKAPPSRLVLHLTAKPTETKEQVRVIKCNRGTHQTLEVYSSVERAMITYGRNLSKELLKKATKPYSPVTDGTATEMIPKEVASSWCPQ